MLPKLKCSVYRHPCLRLPEDHRVYRISMSLDTSSVQLGSDQGYQVPKPLVVGATACRTKCLPNTAGGGLDFSRGASGEALFSRTNIIMMHCFPPSPLLLHAPSMLHSGHAIDSSFQDNPANDLALRTRNFQRTVFPFSKKLSIVVNSFNQIWDSRTRRFRSP